MLYDICSSYQVKNPYGRIRNIFSICNFLYKYSYVLLNGIYYCQAICYYIQRFSKYLNRMQKVSSTFCIFWWIQSYAKFSYNQIREKRHHQNEPFLLQNPSDHHPLPMHNVFLFLLHSHHSLIEEVVKRREDNQ